jgi:type II secretory pathway component PulF
VPFVTGRARAGGDRGRSAAATAYGPPRWTPKSDELDLLAALLGAGVPLVDTLAMLGAMATDASMRSVSDRLQESVRSGRGLAPVLEELAVPSHVRILVEGGERTGRLGPALRSAGVLTLRLETLRAEARRALVYPGVVLLIGFAILTVIAIAVVPPLERTFAELGGDLPRATRMVLQMSGSLRAPSTWALIAMIAAGVHVGRRTSSALVRRLPTAGTRSSALADHLPMLGRLRHDLRMAVLSQAMAALVEAGVPLDAALLHVSEGIAPSRTSRILGDAASATRRGLSPFEPGRLGLILDQAELAMLRVGERTGLVAEQWSRIAERRGRALEDRIKRSSVLIEPMLVAVVGAIVGGAVLALYLPTFRVIELL